MKIKPRTYLLFGPLLGLGLGLVTVSSAAADNSATTGGGQTTVAQTLAPTADLGAKVDYQSATQIADQVKAGQVDPQALVDYTYQQIAANNGELNNVIYQSPEGAAQQVQAMGSDQSAQPFTGVPLLIKGLGQAYQGYPNTDGLPYMQGNKYGYTKNFVQQLQKMGFVILGETNYPELGLINVTDSNLYGPAHNPWDLTRNAGGSSGGAAASVAAGIVPVATGNDAGGSLRIPASWSGVIGLKPTQGIIRGDSLTPSVVNFAETRDINDTVKLFEGLMDPARKYLLQKEPTRLQDLKIAYSLTSPVGSPVSDDAKQAVLTAVDFLRKQGFVVEEKSSPVDGVKLMQAYYLGALSDGTVANYLAQQKLHRNLRPSDVTDGLVSPMTYALYAASKKAPQTVKQAYQAELGLVAAQMAAFHEQYPIYLTPTTATVAPLNSDPAFLPADVARLLTISDLPFDQQIAVIYQAWYHGLSKTPFTQLANVAGEPALSLPTFVNAQGLPLGIQLEGEKGSDLILLALGKLFEEHGQLKFLNTYRQAGPVTDIATTPQQSPVISAGDQGITVLQNTNTNNQPLILWPRVKQADNHNQRIATIEEHVSNPATHADECQLPQTGNERSVYQVIAGLATSLLAALLGVRPKKKC